MADVERLTFTAELERDGSEAVRFRYLSGVPRAELVISREWWEQLGAPETVWVSVEPEK
jgi:hypothetical protein